MKCPSISFLGFHFSIPFAYADASALDIADVSKNGVKEIVICVEVNIEKRFWKEKYASFYYVL